MKARIQVCLIVVLLNLLANHVYAQQSPQQFYQNQIAQMFAGLSDPQAANERVRGIWLELADYSGRMFPVYPAQQFTAGQATLRGIYLDVSIAADPEEEVTRFFLAHEWGHMMHGDPLNQLTPFGRYKMAVGSKAVEDSADEYAARFMTKNDNDVKPVIAFFCRMPNFGPGDTHSSGVDRAKHVAAIYNQGSGTVDVPCANGKKPGVSNKGKDGNSDDDDSKKADESKKEDARRECRDNYDECTDHIISAEQCVQNNVQSCVNACAPNPYRCPDGCSPYRFAGMCQQLENDKKRNCRDKRTTCLKDVDSDDN